MEIIEIILGVKSGSNLVAEVGDGARYRMVFGAVWELFKN